MAITKYFDKIPDISYEGPDSTNPFAYRYYDPEFKVGGKTLADWCRFAVCYWHTFRGNGSDPFGPGSLERPWEDGTDSVEWPSSAPMWCLTSFKSSASTFTASTIATSPPRATPSVKPTPTSGKLLAMQKLQKQDRHQAPLGHRQHVLASTLYPRCEHQPQR